MKKLNRKLIHGTNWALAGLLSVLGFSGCGWGTQVEEYGTPHADFKVTGRVTDEQGQPLSGVRVVTPSMTMKWHDSFSEYRQTNPLRDTVYTSEDGTFVSRPGGVPTDSVYVHMKFEDPSERPAYEPDSVTVGFARGDLKGGDGHWYRGAAEKKVNITLKRKNK